MAESLKRDSSRDIAVIGMAGRFPGANDVYQFWHNLKNGVESISRFTDEELIGAGVSEQLIHNPSYVKASGLIDGAELFDAEFFGFNAREAEVTDPQHRIFLECAWEALEHAGYGNGYSAPVGVFGGCSINTYLNNLATNTEAAAAAGAYQVFIGNDKDFVPTRVSYNLNLTGPSFTVQTACSTSLVAAHVACQSLLTYQSDMALAGGVSLYFPQKTGYLYQEGMILSPDGHCRAFDAKGQGTLGGQGVGIVVLKRLDDALRDGDTIHAVIKGSAINNDGSAKVGFTAPSVDGQAEVIAMAQAMAGVDAESIAYVEAHGTATPLGDPIEIAALTQVFRASTDRKQFCALGSVKTNIGHLDAAAGVAGLIKTVLALENRVIPPSLHFERPNPQIDFDNSPFFVSTESTAWLTDGTPRRAGVSSFGIGGTNAHAVLEEAPSRDGVVVGRPHNVIVLSARSEQALRGATESLGRHLVAHSEIDLASVAYTLQVGRKAFPYRRSLVASDREKTIADLLDEASRLPIVHAEHSDPRVVFMFSGQGSQYTGMARELYSHEPGFREDVDRCAALLEPLLGRNLTELIFAAESTEDASATLAETRLAQPALFVIEYALANLWIRWGVKPHAMIGHSIGEYVAATIAGVLSVEDALRTVALRGRLMQKLPAGTMLAVPLAEDELVAYLDDGVELAAVNAPSFCTVAGQRRSVEALEAKLSAKGVESRRLHTSHAFHSAMMDPVVRPFIEHMEGVSLQSPRLRYVSNVTGTWIESQEPTVPSYWARHLRGTVRFAEGIRELRNEARIFLEIGPGNTLCTFARQAAGSSREIEILASLPHANERGSAAEACLKTLGRLWQCGVPIDWLAFHAKERLYRVPLPTYPFERRRYFVEPNRNAARETSKVEHGKRKNTAEWLYLPSWKRIEIAAPVTTVPARWLLFADEGGLGVAVAELLTAAGNEVVVVRAGETFEVRDNNEYVVNPFRREDYAALFDRLLRRGGIPSKIASFLNVTVQGSDWDSWRPDDEHDAYPAFSSLLALGQALATQAEVETASVFVVSNQACSVTGDESIVPLKSLALGLCKVIPQECPQIRCRSIDTAIFDLDRTSFIADRIARELCGDSYEPVVAHRGNSRWAQVFDAVDVAPGTDRNDWVKPSGTYLISGGLGSVGMLFAERLARAKTRLVLTGRSVFPERREWNHWLATHANDDLIVRRITRILAMETLGAEIVVATADVADLDQMRVVVDDAIKRFGKIDGVIHAAGSPGGSFLLDTGRAHYEAHFLPKVRGVRVIEELFANRDLDFCLLVSSLSSILGGLGFGAYAAANLFLDAVAQKHHWHSDRTVWRSVNWDAWNFSGENVERPRVGASLVAMAMTPAESLEALDIVQSVRGAPQVIVSTGNLDTRIAQWVAREPVSIQLADSPANAQHARPHLKSEYTAPRNDTEHKLLQIWAQLLGIDQVGIHDDFFELGGHSLLGTRVLARVQEAFGVKLPLRALFEAPTGAELAERIQAVLWVKTGRSEDKVTNEEMEDFQF
jgi:acyl transferase domain-containing protein